MCPRSGSWTLQSITDIALYRLMPPFVYCCLLYHTLIMFLLPGGVKRLMIYLQEKNIKAGFLHACLGKAPQSNRERERDNIFVASCKREISWVTMAWFLLLFSSVSSYTSRSRACLVKTSHCCHGHKLCRPLHNQSWKLFSVRRTDWWSSPRGETKTSGG